MRKVGAVRDLGLDGALGDEKRKDLHTETIGGEDEYEKLKG